MTLLRDPSNPTFTRSKGKPSAASQKWHQRRALIMRRAKAAAQAKKTTTIHPAIRPATRTR